MYEWLILFFLLFWLILTLVFITLTSYHLGKNEQRWDNYLRTAYAELTITAILVWIIFMFAVISIVVYYYYRGKIGIGSYLVGIILILFIILLGIIAASALTNMLRSHNFDTRIIDYYYAYVYAILATVFTFVPLILIIIFYLYLWIKE